ncbi:MAG: hypothetical protein ACU0B7_00965 [Paracoccaceae bacterium]
MVDHYRDDRPRRDRRYPDQVALIDPDALARTVVDADDAASYRRVIRGSSSADAIEPKRWRVVSGATRSRCGAGTEVDDAATVGESHRSLDQE